MSLALSSRSAPKTQHICGPLRGAGQVCKCSLSWEAMEAMLAKLPNCGLVPNFADSCRLQRWASLLAALKASGAVDSVAAASETDPLLRASNRLVAFFPVYSAVGYICEVQYSRYLERRSKRIARASGCSATLKLKAGFGREEAEKDEFQIKLLKALAENLQIPETRLAIQSLSEGRGSVKLTASLTRPKEDETGRPCIELWQKLKSDLKVSGTDALSSIDSIAVDGEADEKSKVYSVWITPSGKSAEICKKAITDLSSKCPDSPSIPSPHVPLLQISGEEQEVLGLVERVARETAPFALDFEAAELGKSYFSGVHFPVRSSSSLSATLDALTAQLPSWPRPQWLGGGSCRRQGDGAAPAMAVAFGLKGF
eukprot:s443_g13.t1